jgi:hypothetical protein
MIDRIAGQASQPAVVPQIAEARRITGIGGPAGTGHTRNGISDDLRPRIARTARAAAEYAGAVDPDRPTGPPPTFDANVLEAEMQRMRAGDLAALSGSRDAAAADTGGIARAAAEDGAAPEAPATAKAGRVSVPVAMAGPVWPAAAVWESAARAEPAMDIMR